MTSFASISSASHWQVLESFPLTPSLHVTSYRSSLTGLRVVLAGVSGPLVLGYFTLATEAHSDDGCPHTLEHLIFMGSHAWPYKGVLDLLANRNLSQGTNAWTDIDNTTYTLETAGSEGFLNLLPVYLDHILYPSITDSAFITEVHHITGAGNDAGVVLCEMEAREHTPEDLMTRAVHTALYPGHCGYRSETGGLIADIRQLKADTIRQYHAAYYRPDNLSIVVCGEVEAAALFAVLEGVEADIVARGPLAPLERPWASPVPPFSASVTERVRFPSEDEEHGLVSIGWRSCHWRDFYTRTALDLLWTYLASTSLSPLHKRMIEIEQPYAGDVDSSVLDKSVGIHLVEFTNVDVQRMEQVKDAFFVLLHRLVDEQDFDVERMRSVVRKEMRQTMAGWEEQPSEVVVGYVISNFLYGQEPWKVEERKQEGGARAGEKDDGRGELEKEMKVIERLQALLEEGKDFWLGLIQRWMLDQPYALIIGEPSQAESARLMAEEEARVAAQIAALKAKDPDALVHLGQQLSDAIQRNSEPPPEQLLDTFPAPDFTKVPEHRVFTRRTGDESDALRAQNARHPQASQLDAYLAEQAPLSSLPLSAQFDHIASEFVQLRALLSTEGLSSELKLLLPLYRELMFESPVQSRGGAVLSAEQVVTALEDELVSYESASGLSCSRFTVGSYGQYISLLLKVEASAYSTGLRWLFDLLHGVQFTVERLRVSLKKMLASIPELKNDGAAVVKAASSHINYTDDSMQHAVNFIRQQAMLKRVLKDVDAGHAEPWISQLKAIQTALTKQQCMLLHVAGDFLKQPQLIAEVLALMGKAETSEAAKSGVLPGGLGHLRFSSSYLRPLSDDGVGRAELSLIGVKACRSSFLSTSMPLPSTFSYSDPALPTLRLCLEYLTALEGPMWRRIRGLGYSYSYSMRVDVESGLLSFSLFKSTNLAGGYDESARIVSEFAKGAAAVWKEGDIRAAKSSLGFELLSAGDTATAAADQSLFVWMKGEQPGYNARMLDAVQRVTAAELEQAVQRWLVGLFEPQRSRLCLATNPSQVKDLTAFFEGKAGRKVHLVEHLSSWFEGRTAHTDDGVEDDEEEEEEEGEDDDDDDGDDEDDDEDEEDDDDEYEDDRK